MEMSDRPTTSVIERLKKIVEEEAQKHTYHFSSGTKFNVSDIYPLKQIEKYPTTRETRKYLISRIRWNMLYKDITTQQYRSLKGEIRRGNIIGPVHYIRKFVSGQECLRETLDFMMRKKHLGVGKIPVTLPTTIKTSTIDIEVSKGEGAK